MRKMILAGFILGMVFGCKSPYEMVRTGHQHPPLPANAKINIAGWGEKKNYEQIAIVDVGEYTLAERIKIAKDAARAAGGDTIMPKVSGDPSASSGINYLLQSFIVLKKKPIPEPAEIEPPKVSSGIQEKGFDDLDDEEPDYSNLPRAGFRLLVSDTPSLMGEKFRGSLYPVKFFRTPRRLRRFAKRRRLIMLSTRRGTRRVLLFIPRNQHRNVRKLMRSKKSFRFVYTPVTVYRSKYPVLKFIDTIQ